jgi:hypothetical protein
MNRRNPRRNESMATPDGTPHPAAVITDDIFRLAQELFASQQVDLRMAPALLSAPAVPAAPTASVLHWPTEFVR